MVLNTYCTALPDFVRVDTDPPASGAFLLLVFAPRSPIDASCNVQQLARARGLSLGMHAAPFERLMLEGTVPLQGELLQQALRPAERAYLQQRTPPSLAQHEVALGLRKQEATTLGPARPGRPATKSAALGMAAKKAAKKAAAEQAEAKQKTKKTKARARVAF